jgi:signal peptidase
MKPGIPVGAVVVDTPEDPAAIRVGQVITYQIPVLDHRVVSHRVVAVLSGGDQPVFQTKGDANADPDPWTAQSNGTALWRVRFVVPNAGWAILWLRRPYVHKVLVWLAPALLALAWLNEIWRSSTRRVRPSHAPAPA